VIGSQRTERMRGQEAEGNILANLERLAMSLILVAVDDRREDAGKCVDTS
jgi:hypothetical protein